MPDVQIKSIKYNVYYRILLKGNKFNTPKFKREQLQNETIIIVCDYHSVFFDKLSNFKQHKNQILYSGSFWYERDTATIVIGFSWISCLLWEQP